MPVILSFFNTRDLYTAGVRRTPNQTDSDVTCSRPCDQGKITKRLKDAGLRKTRFFTRTKPVFLKENKPTCFCFFNPLFSFFEKKQVFLIKKKQKKTILYCVHCILQHHHFQNYTIIPCYTYYGIQNWGLRNVPIFVFAKCCWSMHSKEIRLGKHAHSKQRKATGTQTLQFHVKFMQMPC